MKIYVLVQIGCLECGHESRMWGAHTSLDKAIQQLNSLKSQYDENKTKLKTPAERWWINERCLDPTVIAVIGTKESCIEIHAVELSEEK